jgi:hypothetical protein
VADTLISTANIYVTGNANATPTAIQLAATALSRLSVDIDTLVTTQVNVTFYTPSQMVTAGYTLSDGSAAWGYTPDGTHCYINNKINGTSLPSEKTQYTVIHELFHQVDRYSLNSTKRTTIAGLMVPAPSTGAAGWWSAGTYINKPSENFADTAPRAFAGITTVLVGYYGRPVASANYATFISTITGGVGPSATTLASAASPGQTNIKVASVTGFSVGDWIGVGNNGTDEVNITVVGTAGSGGTGITFTPALIANHGNGAAVAQIDPPTTVGGPPSSNPNYSITVGGVDYTNQIPVGSIVLSESGSDAPATFEFTVEINNASDLSIHGNADGFEFPDDSVHFSNLLTNARLFGGTLVGATRRHLTGTSWAQDIRCVSYDAWLDRRYLPTWWTTDTGTSTGNKLADDRLIVQRIIQDGAVFLTASNAGVQSTNTSMPKLNLSDGSLRDHILNVAEAAATVADPTARRVYVDFFKGVHYFKGNENTSAPYRIGDADYATTIKATSGLISFWQMGEASGNKCYDAKGVSNITLSGTSIRGVDGGIINDPVKGAVYFGGNASGSASSASYHPGNVFSIECWFQRTTFGTEQTIVDAGATGDYGLEFQADNTIRLFKRGTGSDFTTTATYTDANWHHLVATHNGTAAHIYVDGVDKNGTAALKTIVASGTSFFVGASFDGTSKYNGSLQGVAFYNVALSAATVTAHYHDGVTLVPDYIDFDTDYNDSGFDVYVRGANSAGSGWNTGGAKSVSTYGANTIIDRPDSDTLATRVAIQAAFLQRDFAQAQGGHFTVVGYDGWRGGQTVTIDDATLGINGNYEIKYLETTFSEAGSDVLTYDVYYGTLPWRGHFDIKRKNRRGTGSA